MKKPMIQVENVSKIYRSGKLKVKALDEVDLEIFQKDFISIVGTSGAGKSTILHLIGALDKPTSGTIKVNGTDLSTLSDDELASFRKENVGFVFQFFNLIPTLTALENVAVSKMFDDNLSMSKAEEVLRKVGLAKKVDHKPNELSEGEQQRVAIASALANDPPVILADEPTGELDTENASIVVQYLHKINKELGKTVIMVTHDPSIARVSDRILRIHDGVVQADVISTGDQDSRTVDYTELVRARISEIEVTIAGLDSQFKQGIITGEEYVKQQTNLKNSVDVLREELHRMGVVN